MQHLRERIAHIIDYSAFWSQAGTAKEFDRKRALERADQIIALIENDRAKGENDG